MIKQIRRFVAVLLVSICVTSHGVSSFSLGKLRASRTQQPIIIKTITLPPSSFVNNEAMSPISIEKQDISSDRSLQIVDNNLKQSLLAGCITFLITTPLSAFAESADDLEIVDLPPVFVPILFAVGVLGGVGVLTASLGNVMDEGELWCVIWHFHELFENSTFNVVYVSRQRHPLVCSQVQGQRRRGTEVVHRTSRSKLG